MQQTEEQSKPQPHQALPSHEEPGTAQDYAGRMFRKFHHHTISDSTTGSNTSSPTTTISTVDDSSATEPSPGSSPESPPPATFSSGMIRPHTADDGRPFFELQKQPPAKKGRNLKNLAVDTTRAPGRAASTTSLPLPAVNPDSLSNGASPAFVKPPTPPKRKPSNLGLTLLTPATNKALPQEIKLAIPPTPASSRPGALRHFQSSPSLPLLPELKTHNFGGPPVRVQTNLETIFSPATPSQNSFPVEEEEEQNFDLPLSKEEKPEAYPDGPICVYDPHIDLYLEPTAKQAMEYDVILNVASEVRNPLVEYSTPDPTKDEIRIDGGGGMQLPPRREQESTQSTQQAANPSPVTPKATPLKSAFDIEESNVSAKEPEYVHIKWEHNSDIVPDLLRLVKLIDEKVSQGKRILVHCQCGVSRSASLVVAYGLYKNPTLSVQQAYDAVKSRSKWIGPNMNLIMQLQEFRSSLTNGGLLPGNRGMTPITPSSQFKEWSRAFPAAQGSGAAPSSAVSTEGATNTLAALSIGPSSAPSGKPWLAKEASASGSRARAISAVKPGTAYVNASGRVVPMIPVLKVVEPEAASSPSAPEPPPPPPEPQQEESDSATPTEALTSPRAAEFAMTPLQPSPEVDPADAFGIMSPSTTEFASSPFDRPALLASLGMGSMRPQDALPRRTSSLNARPKPQPADRSDSLMAGSSPQRLRGKISSPSIREQRQLQSLQASIEARLPNRNTNSGIPSMAVQSPTEPLMSPRATEFTQNPFALVFSPAQEAHLAPEDPPRTPGVDPRSPAQKGISPVTRNIMDVL